MPKIGIKTYSLTVFNTTTGQYEDVQVTREVYNEFRRGEWRISKNDDKHSANETPFSALIGGEDGNYENFREFRSEAYNPEKIMFKRLKIKKLKRAIKRLPEGERIVIELFFFNHRSSKEIGILLGITEQAVTKRRRSAYSHLKKTLRKFWF